MRKGISPLVAAVILIAATMSIAGILSYWTTGFVKTKLGVAENATEETRCLNAEFKVYSISFEDPTLYLVLENTRSYDLTLTDLYLFNENNQMTTITFKDDENLLEGSSLKSIDIDIPDDSVRGLIKTNCPEVSVEFDIP